MPGIERPRIPIINRHTRLVAVMNPALGNLSVQGWERTGEATAVRTVAASGQLATP